MPRHACVETNFLIDLCPMPHRHSRESHSASELWNMFCDREIELHIPYLCLQEALNNQLQKSILRLSELQDIRRYLSDLPGRDWDKEHVSRFFSGVADYLREEQTSAIRGRLQTVWDQIANRGGIIYPEKEVFDLMPLDVADLRPNDHLVLASVVRRAQVLKNQSPDDRIYFCSKDGDLFPVVRKQERPEVVQSRPAIIDLYRENGIEFLGDFILPIAADAGPEHN